MGNQIYPLSMPPEMAAKVRRASKATGLSMADVMRQSMRFGLPKLLEQFNGLESLKPMTRAEARRAFSPDPEWDRLESAMARLPVTPIGEE